MPFTIRQLEIFVEAAKDQNFRKTADRLGMAQPSISKHIKALESAAGGPLFERARGSNARLSPLGDEMLGRARSMLKMAGKLRDGGLSAAGKVPTLRIAAGHYILDQWMRPALRELLAHYDLPEIQFTQADDRDAVLALLRGGEADCGFYHGDPADGAEFATRVLRTSTVGLYAAPPIAANVRTLPDDLAHCPFVLSPVGSSAETYQLHQLEAAGIAVRIIEARSQYTEYQLELVRAGRGVGLLFDDDATALVADGKLVRFPLSFVPGSRCLVTLLETPPDPRLARTIELIGGFLAKPALG